MALLDTTQRQDAAISLIRKMFVEAKAIAQLDTDQVRAMIDGLDDYVEANAAAINQAIPLPVRTLATTEQKALALAFVAMKRGGVI